MTAVLTPHPECLPGPELVEPLQRVLVEVLFHSPSLLMHIHVDQGQGGIEMLHSNCYILKPLSESLLINGFKESGFVSYFDKPFQHWS